METILFITAFVLFGDYLIFSLLAIYGWIKLTQRPITENQGLKNISIVIAFRNEELNLPALLNSLSHLKYPTQQFELILVDDHSLDKSTIIIEEFTRQNPGIRLKVIGLPDNEIGKKAALKRGILNASFDSIATTDADCIIPPAWLLSISDIFTNEHADLIIGGVEFRKGTGFLNFFQNCEMRALQIYTGATAWFNRATMCNGANLAFRKPVYQNAHLQPGKEGASGDDVFLLHHVKKSGGKIIFNKNLSSAIITNDIENFKDFWHQRLRWASKSTKYFDQDILLLGWIIFSGNLLFLMALACLVFYPKFVSGSVFIVSAKIILDSFVVFIYDKNKKLNFGFVLLFSAMYPLYACLTALASVITKYQWKERWYK